MKNKRGFTLIEILIVISIVAVVTISSLALVNKSMENSKERSLEQLYNKIELAAETYLNKNDYLLQNLYNSREPICTKIYTLQNSSLLDFNIKNPVTNETINGSSCVYTYIDDNGYVVTTFRDEVITSNAKTLANKILEDNGIIDNNNNGIIDEDEGNSDQNIDFSTTHQESGLFHTSDLSKTEDGKRVYYFRGDVSNNYVRFARTIGSSSPALWRIVRINEDGSVRLIFDDHFSKSQFFNLDSGTNGIGNYSSQSITVSPCQNHPKCGGYMFGSGQHDNKYNSAAKALSIDDWYKMTIYRYNDGEYLYDSYVSRTAIYCNDRSAIAYSANSDFYFDAYTRLFISNSPQFKCNNDADKFTVSNETGNGLLKYGMALLTADEVVYAGGYNNVKNTSYYLYSDFATPADKTNSYFYTMTPLHYLKYKEKYITNMAAVSTSASGGTKPGRIAGIGIENDGNDSAPVYIRPVLSLKSCVKYSDGDGTSSNPYTVELDTLCSIMPN